MALTTVKLYNDYTGEKGTTEENTQLDSLITNVSQLVEQKCGRTFGTATYKYWLNGDGSNILFLPQYPITRVKRVSNCTHNVMQVENSGSDTATVSSNVSSITLNSLSAIGDEVDTYLYYTDYANVYSMTAAINVVDNWTATQVDTPSNETSLTQFIKPIYAEDAVGEKVHIDLASSNSSFGIAYESRNSLEMFQGVFNCGTNNIYVEWVAGYTLPLDDDNHNSLTVDGDLPAGLTLTVNKIIKDYLDDLELDGNLKSEKLADHGYTHDGVNSIIERYWRDLSEYSYVNP